MPRKIEKFSYKLYIPKSIDLDIILKKYPPHFIFKRDKFIYFLHLLTSVNASKKVEDSDYTTLYSSLLKNKMGSDYSKYIKYLEKHKIIKPNNSYSTIGHFSKKYGFTSNHLKSEMTEFIITDKTFIEKIKKFTNLEKGITLNLLPSRDKKDYEYLDRFFNDKLTIDSENAIRYLANLKESELLEEAILLEKHLTNKKDKKIAKEIKEFKNPSKAYNSRIITVFKINNKQFENTIDRTSYRYHTPLTQLKKGLRKFIRYDGQKLVCIDVKNCQPYLSTVLFNKEFFQKNKTSEIISMYNDIDYNKSPIASYYVSKNVPPKDVKLFIDQVTSGKFYEEFVKLLEKDNLIPSNITDTRSYAKEVVFRTFFSPVYHSNFVNEIKVFQKVYPNVYEQFKFLKSNGKDNTLACTLQRLESSLIIETICKEISEIYPYAPLFTIHDSIITTLEYQKSVKEIMEKILTEYVGYKPQLDVEIWE